MRPHPISVITPPACRIGGLAWIPNERGEVLTVCANYGATKGFHQLPGGHAGEHQSNLAAMVIHVRRETGVDPAPLRLLGTDWVPHNADVPAAMGQNFIYLCADIPANSDIVLPAPSVAEEAELSGYLWQTPETVRSTMRPYQLRRFLGLWSAWRDNTTATLHSGRAALTMSREAS
ncbi:NUDIX domain-containing protein [Streptomyces sp. TE33382]